MFHVFHGHIILFEVSWFSSQKVSNQVFQSFSKMYDYYSPLSNLIADDSAVFKVIEKIHDRQIFQRKLAVLEKWEQTWLMNSNPTRCTVIKLTSQKSFVNPTQPFWLDGWNSRRLQISPSPSSKSSAKTKTQAISQARPTGHCGSFARNCKNAHDLERCFF